MVAASFSISYIVNFKWEFPCVLKRVWNLDYATYIHVMIV